MHLEDVQSVPSPMRSVKGDKYASHNNYTKRNFASMFIWLVNVKIMGIHRVWMGKSIQPREVKIVLKNTRLRNLFFRNREVWRCPILFADILLLCPSWLLYNDNVVFEQYFTNQCLQNRMRLLARLSRILISIPGTSSQSLVLPRNLSSQP